ncbi:type III pantothenate kinase [Chitinibacter sp. ZOR0017]|uniref:type III pantothenate kinase n=1 Tax=Chitinibacter sp. ZOR0017 TaxID=1339254 RepID=UPI00068F7559|nr:type III pantothenate kinase [Chitinibacter sp. ZOR0017]
MTDVLLLDLGNTRLKWRYNAGPVQIAADWPSLQTQFATLPRPQRILLCSVKQPELSTEIGHWCQRHWQLGAELLQVSRTALGVRNHYQLLNQQGPDRWAAILGARSHYPQKNVLVVSAGTALVVDTLSAAGDYLGGTIGPGLGLMKQALQQGTARLPVSSGQNQGFPTQTSDAIETGCRRAIKGMLLEALSEMAQNNIPAQQIVCFGGDAALIASLLNAPCQTVDNLVLDGLYALAQSNDGVFVPCV